MRKGFVLHFHDPKPENNKTGFPSSHAVLVGNNAYKGSREDVSEDEIHFPDFKYHNTKDAMCTRLFVWGVVQQNLI